MRSTVPSSTELGPPARTASLQSLNFVSTILGSVFCALRAHAVPCCSAILGSKQRTLDVAFVIPRSLCCPHLRLLRGLRARVDASLVFCAVQVTFLNTLWYTYTGLRCMPWPTLPPSFLFLLVLFPLSQGHFSWHRNRHLPPLYRKPLQATYSLFSVAVTRRLYLVVYALFL